MNSTTHVIKYSLSSYLISIVFIMMFVPLGKKKDPMLGAMSGALLF